MEEEKEEESRFSFIGIQLRQYECWRENHRYFKIYELTRKCRAFVLARLWAPTHNIPLWLPLGLHKSSVARIAPPSEISLIRFESTKSCASDVPPRNFRKLSRYIPCNTITSWRISSHISQNVQVSDRPRRASLCIRHIDRLREYTCSSVLYSLWYDKRAYVLKSERGCGIGKWKQRKRSGLVWKSQWDPSTQTHILK